MIGQNRSATFQQAKANHDFVEQELKTNTALPRETQVLIKDIHDRVLSASSTNVTVDDP